MKQVILFTLALIIATNSQKTIKETPIIGILTQPTNGSEFIDAHYPIYLGGAGAITVPISYKLPENELRDLMKKLNGVFFTGGTTAFATQNKKTKKWKVTPFGKTAQRIVDIAKKMNDEGKYFPIWGTCMGFQLLAFVISNNPTIPKNGCDCVNYNTELAFTEEGKVSRMFSDFTEQEMKDFEQKNLTFNHHRCYVDTKDFILNKSLKDFFNIVSYSWDKKKQMRFISALEGKKYPFYGTQFHPEVNTYTKTNRIPGPMNVEIAQGFANFFVNEARKNDNNMDRDDLLKKSIWNFPIVRTSGNSFIYRFS